MISGPSLLTGRAALPTASAGTAGTPGFADVLSAADPHLQAPIAAPQRPVAPSPGAPQAPTTPARPAGPKAAEPPPAHTPGGRAEPSPTASAPNTTPRPTARAASTSPAPPAHTTTEADGAPALLSAPVPPSDEGGSVETAPAETPPSLQSLLAALQPANEPAPALAWGGWDAGQDKAGATGDEPLARHGAVRGRIHLPPETTTIRVAAAAPDEATAHSLGLLTGPIEATAVTSGLPTAFAEVATAGLPGLGLNVPQPGVSTAGAAPVASALPTAQAQIAASPGSPAFAPELGAQISTFVRQGVERAQLQLHPAEMGPVTVQILVEGAAAQVRLWAEQPGTRTALEQAMPTLAGQLRESGLTLTGGGVFEQGPQTPEQAWREARHGAAPAPGSATEPASPALAAPTRRRGVVDLIA